MSIAIEQEVKKLQIKSDDELMKIYAQQILDPQTGIVNALGFIMQERNIKPGSMVIAFNYTDSKGSEKMIKLMEA